MKLNFVFRIRQKYFSMSYFIQVWKTDQIFAQNIQSVKQTYIIHDGPGILADKLKNLPVPKCSTFQCVIQLLTQNLLPQSGYSFTFCSKPLPFSDIITQYQTFSLNLPNINCFIKVFIISLTIRHGQQINVTVNKIASIGLYHPNCAYSGLKVGERLKDDYRESVTLCHNHDRTQDPSRNFYSYNSSLTLVLYWYEGYNIIKISVTVSKTI